MPLVLKDCGIWIDGRDFAADFSEVNLALASTPGEVTNFASGGWMENIEGLASHTFGFNGFYDAESGDRQLFEGNGSHGDHLVAPAGDAFGRVAYVLGGVRTSYSIGDAVGSVFPAAVAAQGSLIPHRAKMFSTLDGVSAMGSTQVRRLGEVPADQHIAAWCHVRVNSGMVDIELRSQNQQLNPTVVERARQLGVSESGMYLLQAPGPITDPYWFVRLNPHGVNPDIDIAVATAFPSQAVVIPSTPVRPPTPTPTTHTLLGGLSADTNPVAGEITIDPVMGMPGRINYGTFGNSHALIARVATQPDIMSVVIVGDPTGLNQIGGFSKFATPVSVGGTDYSVWVSNQSLSAVNDFVLDIA